MKRIILAILCICALVATAVPAIAQGYDYDYRGGQAYRGHQDYRGYPGYRGHQDYRGYPGYRGNYNYGRHGYYGYRGHRYAYRGHYRNWNDWDRYARRHPEWFRYGRYYREGGQLMFRTCDPSGLNCFYFSIGR